MLLYPFINLRPNLGLTAYYSDQWKQTVHLFPRMLLTGAARQRHQIEAKSLVYMNHINYVWQSSEEQL